MSDSFELSSAVTWEPPCDIANPTTILALPTVPCCVHEVSNAEEDLIGLESRLSSTL